MPLSLTKSKRGGGYARKKSRRHKRYKSRKSKSRKLRNRSSKILRGGQHMTDIEIQDNITQLINMNVDELKDTIDLLVKTLFHIQALQFFHNHDSDNIKRIYPIPSRSFINTEQDKIYIITYIKYLINKNTDYKNMFLKLCIILKRQIFNPDTYDEKYEKKDFETIMLEYFNSFLYANMYSEDVKKDIIDALYADYKFLGFSNILKF